MAYKDRRKSKTGKTIWVAAITCYDARLGYRDRKAERPFPTKRAAQEREQQIVQEAARGEYLSPRQRRRKAKKVEAEQAKNALMTIDAFKDEYLLHQEAKILRGGKKLSHAYVAEKESIIKHHLVPGFPMPICEIDEEAVDKFQDRLVARGYQTSTITNILGELRVILKQAKRWKRIDRVPEFDVPGKELRKVQKVIPLADLRRLLQFALPEVRLPLLFSVLTGLRFGAMVAVKWGDLNFDEGTLHVQRSFVEGRMKHPKSRKDRVIGVDSRLLDVLARYREETAYGENDNFIFTKADGSNYSYKELYPLLIKSCDAAGVKRISWHWTRHTYITMMSLAGVAPRVAMQQAGHSDVRVTMLAYSHVNLAAMKSAAQAVAEKMPPEIFCVRAACEQ